MVGAIGGGVLADKFHLKPVLTIMFAVGTNFSNLLGFNSPQAVLYLLIALAGAATIGSQILLYTFVAQFYPTAVRSTGMGWASGIGRIGAIVGPVLTGALLTFELPHQMNFLAIAIPGVIAAIAIFLVNLKASVDGVKQLRPHCNARSNCNEESNRLNLSWPLNVKATFFTCISDNVKKADDTIKANKETYTQLHQLV